MNDANTTAVLDILVCPETKARLVRDGERLVSRDGESRLSYPIRDGIPIMLADEATSLSVDEWQDAMNRSGESADG